ncbi:PEP-CTERM sorting domain-containing protein [Luteolibacter marinus]|uniref:PEP-CTERM sorting domain-containing protein n=1 Tax=Luteolibacter marinus TaxID=2776705 RepID=UPI001866D851|nr:PEP-CTERM sorting domain-containing protein [Luteolibacter marinus]
MFKTTALSSFAIAGLLTCSCPGAISLFNSAFDANVGATELAGNTDNTSGSATVTITDWYLDSAVTGISALTAISTDNGITAGGFAQLQGGTAAYANEDNLYLSRNSFNQGTAPRQRGFSLTFTLDSAQDLLSLTVLSGHTNNTGIQDQAYSSDLVFSLAGGTLGSAVTASITESYDSGPAYHPVVFDLNGTSLGAGTYTLEVYQTNATGGSYAIYDGINLVAVPEPSIALLGGLGLLGLLRHKR